METLREKLNEHYKTKNGVTNAMSRIRRLTKLMDIDSFDDLLQDDGKKLIETINSNITVTCRRVYTHQVITCCKLLEIAIPDALSDAIKEYKKEEDTAIEKRRDEESVNENLDMDKICKYFRDQIDKRRAVTTSIKDKQGNVKIVTRNEKCKYSNLKAHRLVMMCILRDRAIRISELAGCMMEDDGESNYYDMENNQLVIRHDKGSRITGKSKHEPRIIQLSDKSKQNIRWYNRKTKSKYLFPALKGKDDKAMGANSLIHSFNISMKVYCKANNIEYAAGKMGIHELRRKENMDQINEDDCDIVETLKKIERMAYERGHSLDTAIKFYTRSKRS